MLAAKMISAASRRVARLMAIAWMLRPLRQPSARRGLASSIVFRAAPRASHRGSIGRGREDRWRCAPSLPAHRPGHRASSIRLSGPSRQPARICTRHDLDIARQSRGRRAAACRHRRHWQAGALPASSSNKQPFECRQALARRAGSRRNDPAQDRHRLGRQAAIVKAFARRILALRPIGDALEAEIDAGRPEMQELDGAPGIGGFEIGVAEVGKRSPLPALRRRSSMIWPALPH